MLHILDKSQIQYGCIERNEKMEVNLFVEEPNSLRYAYIKLVLTNTHQLKTQYKFFIFFTKTQ
jgi:hypothetical protein